jgi:hypothetical protein
VEETSTNQTPPSTIGLEVCEASSSSVGRNVLGGARLFPNPANGVVQLSGIPSATKWFGQLIGTDGKLIHSYHGAGSEAIDFYGVSKGIYSLNIGTPEGAMRTFRIVQQ